MNRFDRFYNQGYSDADSPTGYCIGKPTEFSPDDWRAYKCGVSQWLYDTRKARCEECGENTFVNDACSNCGFTTHPDDIAERDYDPGQEF